MDLWVRSQDRNKLVKIEAGLYINMPEDFGSGEFSVYTDSTLTNNGLLRLGKYKTKERALEVLDEIQDYLINLDKAVIYSMTPADDYLNVYEMPKE